MGGTVEPSKPVAEEPAGGEVSEEVAEDGLLGLPPGRAGTEGRARREPAAPSPPRRGGTAAPQGTCWGSSRLTRAGSRAIPAGGPAGDLGCAGGLLGMLIPSPRYPAPRGAEDPRPLAAGVRPWALTRVFVELPWSGTTALGLPRKPFFLFVSWPPARP